VTFVTGHQRSDGQPIDWRELARPGHTTVFYMGLSQLENIFTQLLAAGAPPSRPAAVIERATFADQRIVEGTLATLAQQVAAAGVRSPSLLIVGEVVALRSSLAHDAQLEHRVKYA
jgi:uroporphyrin-III C-methyltransferase / precorrin-2 dehydrogenase / sirohydrochlorin ferrochelatase